MPSPVRQTLSPDMGTIRLLMLHCFYIIIALSTHTTATLAQRNTTRDAELKQPYNVSVVSPYAVGRYRSISTESPVSRAMREHPEWQEKALPLFSAIDTLTKLSEKRREEAHTEACELFHHSKWVTNTGKRPQILQIGDITDECFTIVDVDLAERENDLPRSFGRTTTRAIRDAKEVLFEASKTIDFPKDGNWTDSRAPFILKPEPRKRKGQTCHLDSASAYRVNGEWYVLSAATNHPMDMYAQDWQRHIIQEYVPRHYKHSLPMIQKRLTEDVLEKSSTIVMMVIGTLDTTTVPVDLFDDPVGPVAAAYKQNLVPIDQAADAITASNIAILALPMAMNLVPIAYVADVNAIGMFSYILVTDVFSAIPFFIKGVELIRSSLPKREHVSAFFTGNATIGRIEIFSAECRGIVQFRITGIVFVLVSLAVLFTGLALEVWAWRVMNRKREVANNMDGYPPDRKVVQGPFGPVLSLRQRMEDEYLTYSEEFERAFARQADGIYNKHHENGSGQRVQHVQPAMWRTNNWGANGSPHVGAEHKSMGPRQTRSWFSKRPTR